MIVAAPEPRVTAGVGGVAACLSDALRFERVDAPLY